ncbi:MAG: hypothetical protein ABEI52_02040 [Halobacteriaceae archaeon]
MSSRIPPRSPEDDERVSVGGVAHNRVRDLVESIFDLPGLRVPDSLGHLTALLDFLLPDALAEEFVVFADAPHVLPVERGGAVL